MSGGGRSNISYRGLVNQYLSAFIQAAKDFQGAMKVSIALGLFSFIFCSDFVLLSFLFSSLTSLSVFWSRRSNPSIQGDEPG